MRKPDVQKSRASASAKALLGEGFIQRLEDKTVKRLVVGLSGGIDSVVLLDALSKTVTLPVWAIHVNHQLHPKADAFEQFCAGLGDRYGIEVLCQRVLVQSEGSLELRAREARYQAFEDLLVEGDLLLLAHHADDQVETVLFRLFRGSRVPGLEGMPRERPVGNATLYRPLLDTPRQAIELYAKEHELGWCDDPTNPDTDADRNYIRHRVLPVIDSRFPGARKAILAGLDQDELARRRLAEALDQDLALVRHARDGLLLKPLRARSSGELVMLFTRWLDDLQLPQPSGKALVEMANNVIDENRIELIVGDLEFREHDGVVYVLQAQPADSLSIEHMSVEHMSVDPVPVKPWSANPTSEAPLAEHQQSGKNVQSFPLLAAGTKDILVSNTLVKGGGLKASPDYRVRFRSGQEKIRIGRNRDIKNVFQENHIPAWLRDRVPLIYAGDSLVAVAGIPGWQVPMLVADGWAPENAGEEGYEISLILDGRSFL